MTTLYNLSRGVDERFGQGKGDVEVHESQNRPYNPGQWRSLHIGNQYDKHPGSGTIAARNNHTMNDYAQSGAYPWKNHYSPDAHFQNAETGDRQYKTHEFSTLDGLQKVPVSGKQNDIFHAVDPEMAVPSYGHSLLSKGGYKGNAIQQVAPGQNTSIAAPNQYKKSKFDIEDLRSMYTLDHSIQNFITLDRVAKQNFMHAITDIRREVA